MLEFLSIDTVFFQVLGYPMSYLEFFGTLLNVACVWLVARNSTWNWPVGIAGVVLFMFLFYQVQLYSDMIEQVYYLATGFYGWWLWGKLGKPGEAALKLAYNRREVNVAYLAAIAVGTLAMGLFISNIHALFPQAFPEPASFPYLDAFTTVLSVAAQLMLVYRRIESWYLWILVDVIGVALYYAKDVKLVSLLYLVFLALAIRGLVNWTREYRAVEADAAMD
jgi:nicotinamide mononucleotide transporter